MTGQNTRTGKVSVFADKAAASRHLADWLLQEALAKQNGPFSIALSGGSTPQLLYSMMASEPYASRFPWARMQFFLGDDRFLAHDHADSNSGMLHRLLFSRVPVSAENVHLIPTADTAEEAAKAYEAEMKAFYGADTLQPGRPLFDVNLLGLGSDGHTASLFPGQPVLKEQTAWVSTCVPPVAPYTRLTMTYPAIDASRHVIFLVEGASKRETVAKVRAQDPACPASAITAMGELTWVLDRDAAPADQ
ncbi:6-phosphogluconolactonase [Acetobacter orleanensis]|uniref:6-phosphogluconolactonase n=1 Tax=Acetobacter orleanensis TaxID=104099 RepID=A0A4Y3TRC9_9PROT|nr:6-phosphogluconolactonase [Acetobacter orleanensis]KXV65874.1 6-phosphogluconolactonase [Acetobacter orleanensis]PCD79773.1 6-phosphogluconolactonase [Acetobacter orleanensis]GAN69079.1 6-phosphogluconolactonase [Acetobacter orleanensis JCM 7639]GBR28489.1 6-phosphogluconolactonase [Acetobacter orleanensis NRIC 0473]GEB83637.1 6-phosphogluconolactonase [Acetobacter orleanensis]